MDIKFLLDIAGVSFELLIAYLFFRIFLLINKSKGNIYFI